MALTRRNSGVTVRDVASHAGVSIGTVSRALKNQAGLTEQTRQQVLSAASELGYDTTNLRPAKLKRVGFLTSRLPDLPVNPFYSHVLHGVETACASQQIVLSYTALRPSDRVAEVVRRLEADGLLCIGYFDPKPLERIIGLGIPTVLVDHWSTSLPSVNMDNFGGAYQAVQHLLAAGRQRIAFIGGPNHYSVLQRARGFRQALFDAGVPADPALEVMRDPVESKHGAQSAMQRLLELSRPPDAVFGFNDETALVAMSLCLERGIGVPEEIAFVGFDDIESATHSYPSLSTLRVDKELLGQRGVELLLRRDTIEENLVPVRLVVRESSSAAV